MRREARLAATTSVLLLLAAGCPGPVLHGLPAGPRAAPVAPDAGPGVPAAGEGLQVVQVILRDATDAAGGFAESAVRAAADAAVTWLLDAEFPLDAWRRLADARGAAGGPPRGQLAEVVAQRLDLAGAAGAAVTVWRPDWREGRLDPPPPAAVLSGPLLVDLLAPRVDGRTWTAGIVLAASDPAAAALVAHFTLQARATGRAPDLERLARHHGVPLDAFDWQRAAVVDGG